VVARFVVEIQLLREAGDELVHLFCSARRNGASLPCGAQ